LSERLRNRRKEGLSMEKAVKTFEKLQTELEEYRKQGNYNVLVPTLTIQEISPFHKPVLEIVRINPDPKAGEVYEIVQGSGDFSMRAVALQKIGYAAGLIWNVKGCGRTDDGSRSNIVTYRAEAAVRKEDGTYMPLNAEYMVDLDVIEEETRESYEKKSQALMKEKKAKNEKWTDDDRKAYVERSVRRDMLQKRKFRLQLAQTGAMDRVIRKILGLKGTYKKEELSKPFVVPKIAFNPDVNDPKVREMLLRQGLDATTVLFGPVSEKSLIDYQPGQMLDKVIDMEPGGNGGDEQEEKTNEMPIEEVPFDRLDIKGQIDHLKALMKKKGYPDAKLKKPLDKFSDTERGMFFDHLKGMADVNELPFD
jgi:hypothetical protein